MAAPVLVDFVIIMDRMLRYELSQLKQELQHLIYPLNYKANCCGLNSSQEEFFDLYEQDWRAFTEQLFGVSTEATSVDAEAEAERLCSELSREERIQLLGEALLLLLSKCLGYDSRLRELMIRTAQRLAIGRSEFMEEIEGGLIDRLEQLSVNGSNNVASNTVANVNGNTDQKWSRRRWLVATASVITGAAACGFTAGIAAPFFLPAFSSAVGLTAGAGAFLAGTGGVALMATVFGVAGAGMAGYRVSRRFAGLKDFKFIPLRDRERNRNFRVVIATSGWLGSRAGTNDTPSSAWIAAFYERLDLKLFDAEFYCLSFEEEVLRSFGNSLADFLKSTAVTVAAAQVLRMTVTAAATSALMLPVSVLQAGDLIDNPWTLGVDRARKAGKALAEALRCGAQGRRPVTLVGYSLGALVIFSCLEELARIIHQESQGLPRNVISRAGSALDLSQVASLESTCIVGSSAEQTTSLFGIIENVVLMGLPEHVPTDSIWCQLKLLVSGRFVHCYSSRDWILRFLHRSSTVKFNTQVAGLAPVGDAVSCIESVDVSDLISSHQQYETNLSKILERINMLQ